MNLALRYLRLPIIFLLALIILGCQPRSSHTSPTVPLPTKANEVLNQQALLEAGSLIDGNKARALADRVVKLMCGKDQEAMYDFMEKVFSESMPREQIGKMMQGLFSFYGTPVIADYKRVEHGKRYMVSDWKPLHTYWYAVETSKHPKGTHFLIVQIMLANNVIAVSAIQFVTFPLGKIPPFLR